MEDNLGFNNARFKNYICQCGTDADHISAGGSLNTGSHHTINKKQINFDIHTV